MNPRRACTSRVWMIAVVLATSLASACGTRKSLTTTTPEPAPAPDGARAGSADAGTPPVPSDPRAPADQPAPQTEPDDGWSDPCSDPPGRGR